MCNRQQCIKQHKPWYSSPQHDTPLWSQHSATWVCCPWEYPCGQGTCYSIWCPLTVCSSHPTWFRYSKRLYQHSTIIQHTPYAGMHSHSTCMQNSHKKLKHGSHIKQALDQAIFNSPQRQKQEGGEENKWDIKQGQVKFGSAQLGNSPWTGSPVVKNIIADDWARHRENQEKEHKVTERPPSSSYKHLRESTTHFHSRLIAAFQKLLGLAHTLSSSQHHIITLEQRKQTKPATTTTQRHNKGSNKHKKEEKNYSKSINSPHPVSQGQCFIL